MYNEFNCCYLGLNLVAEDIQNNNLYWVIGFPPQEVIP